MVTHLCSQKHFLSCQLELRGPYHKHGTHLLFTLWVVFGDMFRGLGVFHINEMLFRFHQPNPFLFFLLISFFHFFSFFSSFLRCRQDISLVYNLPIGMSFGPWNISQSLPVKVPPQMLV